MLNIITSFCYCAGTLAQTICIFKKNFYLRCLVSCFGILAVLLHCYLLYRWIDLATGQNFNEFILLSLAAWVTSTIILIMTIKQSNAYLTILIFPLSALSILMVSYFPSSHIIKTAAEPKQFIHILLSVVTFSVLLTAGLLALTLACQERFLRHRNFSISRGLPSIEATEKLLFQMIAIGAGLLSLELLSSIFFFRHILLEQFLQKTILTFIAWLVFILLLIGRHYFGWRGKRAIYCTFSGVGILGLIYFSSLIIMELIP